MRDITKLFDIFGIVFLRYGIPKQITKFNDSCLLNSIIKNELARYKEHKYRICRGR